jgi:hypothetical protein
MGAYSDENPLRTQRTAEEASAEQLKKILPNQFVIQPSSICSPIRSPVVAALSRYVMILRDIGNAIDAWQIPAPRWPTLTDAAPPRSVERYAGAYPSSRLATSKTVAFSYQGRISATLQKRHAACQISAARAGNWRDRAYATSDSENAEIIWVETQEQNSGKFVPKIANPRRS